MSSWTDLEVCSEEQDNVLVSKPVPVVGASSGTI